MGIKHLMSSVANNDVRLKTMSTVYDCIVYAGKT